MIHHQLAVAMAGDTDTMHATINTYLHRQLSPATLKAIAPFLDALTNPQTIIESTEKNLAAILSDEEAQSMLDMTTHPGWLVYHGKAAKIALAQAASLQNLLSQLVQVAFESEARDFTIPHKLAS